MALIKCPECQSQISDKAIACPKCGCPKKDMIFDEDSCMNDENTYGEDEETEVSTIQDTNVNSKNGSIILLTVLVVVIFTIMIVCILNSLPSSYDKSSYKENESYTQSSEYNNNDYTYSYNSSYITTNSLTLSKYKKIQTGMSYSEVVNILGSKGNLVSSMDISGISIRGYGWYGQDGIPMICVVFQNGKANTIYQMGLQ